MQITDLRFSPRMFPKLPPKPASSLQTAAKCPRGGFIGSYVEKLKRQNPRIAEQLTVKKMAETPKKDSMGLRVPRSSKVLH